MCGLKIVCEGWDVVVRLVVLRLWSNKEARYDQAGVCVGLGLFLN